MLWKNGLRREDLEGEKTDSGAFSGGTLKAAESLYKEVQSRKSALGDILNQARKNAEKLE